MEYLNDKNVEEVAQSLKPVFSSLICDLSSFHIYFFNLFQFDNIGSHGTKIIIFNLWMNDEGIYELCFDDDDEVNHFLFSV